MKPTNAPKHQPTMTGKPNQDTVLEPLEKTISTKRKSLQDLKSLLEDRGGIDTRNVSNEATRFKRNVFEKDKSSNNSVYRVDNKVNFGVTLSVSGNNTAKCNAWSGRGRWCFSRFKTIMFLLLVMVSMESRLCAEARSSAKCRGTENQPAKKARGDGSGNDGSGGGRDHHAYDCLLKNELLGAQIEELRGPPATCAENKSALGNVQLVSSAISKAYNMPSVYRFRAPIHSAEENIDPSPYSLSPISAKSEKLLRSPRKATRKISRIPFKVLDAPELQDDFYLNLVDWSALNVLSVGLGSCVYLWSACTSQVTRLCDLSSEGNAVTSVAWSERGHLVAVGTQKGHISVWDVAVNKEVTKLQGHMARVGALAWNGDILSSGSRDRHIRQRDTRTPPIQSARVLQGHRQEVCGLKWSPDGQSLASGGNDNKLFVWSMHSTSPVQTYSSHVAAVKAIAWSPHQHGLLASGGGTADRCIRFWNTLTSQPMQCVDTGSQVCNLAWSKHSSELVSTHGYSQNQILVWKYPSLTQVAKLTGHSYRVLYLALSPDGEAIVTGAGDETLRFWNVFSKTPSHKENKSVLNLYTALR